MRIAKDRYEHRYMETAMLFRRITLALALLAAALASQVPAFVDQYAQRLGGAIDELRAEVAAFDADAQSLALSREDALERLAANPDPVARRRGSAVQSTVARLDRLERQRTVLDAAGPVARCTVFIEGLDRRVASGTYADFAPAVPVSAAALVASCFGFAAGWVIATLIGGLFRATVRRPVPRQA